MHQKIIDLYYLLMNSNRKIKAFIGLKTGKFKRYSIVPINEVAEEIAIFKEETEEEFFVHKIYGFIKRGSFITTMPKLPLWRIKNAEVYNGSDFIRIGDNVVWPKKEWFNFCKLIPKDKIADYDEGSLIIRKPTHVHKVECGFSLIGTNCGIWSHCLSDYFPKLSMLGKAIEIANKEVTVLVPDYQDSQLKQIIYDSIHKHQNAKILVMRDGEAVEVETLFYIERPCRFTDHEDYVEIGDSIQPKLISDILKKDLVDYYKSLYKIEDDEKGRKLFLARKPGYRNIYNYSEVKEYFIKQGFEVIEPHRFSLEEKIKLFSEAKYIVGPYSSGFSNTMFSPPGTKCLILSNYNRAFECWLTMQEQYFGIDILTVTGTDNKRGSRAHCSYTIPLSKIIDAAKFHGIIEDKEYS